jgi:hypothetical protein
VGQRQINIRLADEDMGVLEAASFLEAEPLHEVVRAILLDRVAGLRADPKVQQALRLRAERTAEHAGVLSSLDARRRQPGDGKPT